MIEGDKFAPGCNSKSHDVMQRKQKCTVHCILQPGWQFVCGYEHAWMTVASPALASTCSAPPLSCAVLLANSMPRRWEPPPATLIAPPTFAEQLAIVKPATKQH